MRKAAVLLMVILGTRAVAQEGQKPAPPAAQAPSVPTPNPDLEARITAEEAANGFHCATILRKEGKIKAPELPPELATVAAAEAQRLKTPKAAQKAWEKAVDRKDREAAWRAALAYEHLATPKPALNPGFLVAPQWEWTTQEQCQMLVPYLLRGKRYLLCQDRVGTPDHAIRDWKYFNTPRWAHTNHAICACCETLASGALQGTNEECRPLCQELASPPPQPQ